jgi:hypothetical protein
MEIHMRVNRILIARRFLIAALIAAGGAVLTADGASAARHPQGYASGSQIRETSSPRNVFESYANGRQPYENPDRVLYMWGN